ncbi:DUF1684 domain-containing protein [Pseudonocardia sp. NPDC046786]|uniref:DUF1684 domain-containing protein n=1 Tax=Pseudonocardia sp. NPDC046786 TaxID=3155471 RepID=UPI00340D6DAA
MPGTANSAGRAGDRTRTRYIEFRIEIPRNLPDSDVPPSIRPLVEAEGLYALRAIEEQLLETAFGGIEVYEPDIEWVIPGRFVPVLEPTGTTVPYTDGRDRSLAVAGEIRCTVDGREISLTASPLARGRLHVIFADRTRSELFPFRFLSIDPPDDDGHVMVDFNRSVVPLAAFSEYCPGPTPPPGNTLDIAVTAGEDRPFLGTREGPGD